MINAALLEPETPLRFWDGVNAVPGPGFGNTGYVLTEQVRAGYFWFIPYIHLADFNNNGQFVALFLVDPAFYGSIASGKFPNGFPEPAPPGVVCVSPTTGQNAFGIGGSFAAKVGNPICPFLYNYILVPSGWALLLLEQNNFAPGSPMEMRFLYRVIRNECMPMVLPE
jgi:hypothetical protein